MAQTISDFTTTNTGEVIGNRPQIAKFDQTTFTPMGFLSFLSKLLGLGRRFSGTPEQYLAMVQYMAQKNNPEYSHKELLQRGEVVQKVMKVNLHSYQDFRDLAENGIPDDSMVQKVDQKVNKSTSAKTWNKPFMARMQTWAMMM